MEEEKAKGIASYSFMNILADVFLEANNICHSLLGLVIELILRGNMYKLLFLKVS